MHPPFVNRSVIVIISLFFSAVICSTRVCKSTNCCEHLARTACFHAGLRSRRPTRLQAHAKSDTSHTHTRTHTRTPAHSHLASLCHAQAAIAILTCRWHTHTCVCNCVRDSRYQARRLSEHPSIVVYDGCNECNSKGRDIYTAFVMTTIATADPSKAIWPSCPAAGWTSGVHRLTSLPNGDELVARNDGQGVNDSHGPYVTGNAGPWGADVDEDAYVGTPPFALLSVPLSVLPLAPLFAPRWGTDVHEDAHVNPLPFVNNEA